MVSTNQRFKNNASRINNVLTYTKKIDKVDELIASTCRRIEMIYNMLMHFYNILSNLNSNADL